MAFARPRRQRRVHERANPAFIVLTDYGLWGSKADILAVNRHVRFTPKSGHGQVLAECPLCAKSRQRTSTKSLATLAAILRASSRFSQLTPVPPEPHRLAYIES